MKIQCVYLFSTTSLDTQFAITGANDNYQFSQSMKSRQFFQQILKKKKAKKYNFELKTQSSVRYQARKEKLGSIIAPNISPDIYVT